MDTSDPIRFLIGIDLFLSCDPNVHIYVYMAFTQVVSESSVSRAHLTHLDRRRLNGRVITIWHLYVFDFNESPAAGESYSLPAPSIRKEEDNTATSDSRPVLYLCKG